MRKMSPSYEWPKQKATVTSSVKASLKIIDPWRLYDLAFAVRVFRSLPNIVKLSPLYSPCSTRVYVTKKKNYKVQLKSCPQGMCPFFVQRGRVRADKTWRKNKQKNRDERDNPKTGPTVFSVFVFWAYLDRLECNWVLDSQIVIGVVVLVGKFHKQLGNLSATEKTRDKRQKSQATKSSTVSLRSQSLDG